MNIKLVSQDVELYKLCHEILGGFAGRRCTLSMLSPDEAAGLGPRDSTDLYIWDFSPELSLKAGNWAPSKNLFLVDRKDVALFRKNTKAAEVHILLKPVMRTTMAAFLGFAISTDSISIDSSLRAERDQILQCLIQTNLKLQEYDHDRTNFLARAVHDFHAPLTALGGYCGLLLSEGLGPLQEDQREVLKRMNHSVKRLSRMASAMFQLSIGRQVKRHPDLRAGDLRECLDQAMHEIAPFADEKHISITPELETPEEPLHFDSGQMEQVLINLLDNACKFTPKFGSIEIRGYPYFWERRRSGAPLLSPAVERRYHASREPNSYRIDITDSGSAIPREHLERIFEEYTSYSGRRDRSGGGLGLSICRMIITQHDGHVWAENTKSGPMFSFVLPLCRPETLPADGTPINEPSMDAMYRGE